MLSTTYCLSKFNSLQIATKSLIKLFVLFLKLAFRMYLNISLQIELFLTYTENENDTETET
jgi:hypothetical protein